MLTQNKGFNLKNEYDNLTLQEVLMLMKKHQKIIDECKDVVERKKHIEIMYKLKSIKTIRLKERKINEQTEH